MNYVTFKKHVHKSVYIYIRKYYSLEHLVPSLMKTKFNSEIFSYLLKFVFILFITHKELFNKMS